MVPAAGGEYPKGTSSRFTLRRPLACGSDSDETRLRDHKRPPPRPKSEPSEAGPIWKGGATKRYKVFGASPQTDAGNVVSAVCSDAVVPAAGVEYPKGTSSRFTLRRPLACGGDSDETRLRDHKRPPRWAAFCGAGGGGRTRTVLPPGDFKSPASACSATPARFGTGESYHHSRQKSMTCPSVRFHHLPEPFRPVFATIWAGRRIL